MRKIMCGDANFGVLVFSSQYIHQKVTFSLWVHEICQIILSRTTASSDEKWIFCERRLTYYVSAAAAVVVVVVVVHSRVVLVLAGRCIRASSE